MSEQSLSREEYVRLQALTYAVSIGGNMAGSPESLVRRADVIADFIRSGKVIPLDPRLAH